MLWQIELVDEHDKHIILVITETTVDVQGATLLHAKPLEVNPDEGYTP